MISSVNKGWDISKTILYKHIKTKDNNEQNNNQLLQVFLEILKSDDDSSLSFVKENKKFIELLNKYK